MCLHRQSQVVIAVSEVEGDARYWSFAGKHAAEILAMSLEGFGDSRRMLSTLAEAAAAKASAPSTASISSQLEDYQALDRMAAQNMVAIKVRAELLLST